MSEPAIAIFNDYPGLVEALRVRARERKLALSADENAAVAGLPDGYIAKLIGSNPVKRIGINSLGALAGLLAVKFVMVEDEQAERQYGHRLKTRNDNLVHADTVQFSLTGRFMRKIRLKGGHNSRKNLGKRKRKQLARKAAAARWSKPRVVEIKGKKGKHVRDACK